MPAVQSIVDEIFDLKQQRRAVILAHHYQESEIQELADAIGDSLELARKAQEFGGDVIAFCGVRLMAEMAKALNPSRVVVLPDFDAGCSLVDSCTAALKCARSSSTARRGLTQMARRPLNNRRRPDPTSA
jgi:quinolinate synthase